MSLWDLLTFLSAATSLSGSLVAMKSAKLGDIYYLIAITIGLLTGILCILTIRIIGSSLFRLIDTKQWLQKQAKKKKENIAYKLIYFLAFIWLFISEFFGYKAAKLFIGP
jgi:hypothetical protein